jgi:hypothetical protein
MLMSKVFIVADSRELHKFDVSICHDDGALIDEDHTLGHREQQITVSFVAAAQAEITSGLRLLCKLAH